MSLLAALVALVSLIPTSLALIASLFTAVLFPLVFALLLGTAELISSILASIESVTLLVLSPPVLLFPIRVLGGVAAPLADSVSVVLAPALYPFQALLVFFTGIASFFLEFKVCDVNSRVVWSHSPTLFGDGSRSCNVPLYRSVHD